MNANEIPRNEPLEARAGLTWQWRREDLVADYPASSWALKYYFKKLGATAANFEIDATADGDNFKVLVAASTTAAYAAGDYAWAAEVSGGSSEVYEVDRGRLKLLPRYDQAANLDDRSHAKKVLDALELAIENKALLTPDQLEYTIGSRHIKRMSFQELIAARQTYRGLVAMEEQEERARNGRGGNRLAVKF